MWHDDKQIPQNSPCASKAPQECRGNHRGAPPNAGSIRICLRHQSTVRSGWGQRQPWESVVPTVTAFDPEPAKERVTTLILDLHSHYGDSYKISISSSGIIPGTASFQEVVISRSYTSILPTKLRV